MFLNIYSMGPLIIVRVPELPEKGRSVRWRKIVQAAGRLLRSHGFKAKDITSIDREGLEDSAKLEEAFNGGPHFAAFMLYDFDIASGEFRLARGVVSAPAEELTPYQKAHADGILDFGEGLSATFFTGLSGETPVVFRKRPWLGDKEPVVCPAAELEYAHGYIDGYSKAGERAGGG